MPIVSVNPEADPPQPRAPVRPNRAEQDGETAEEKSQEHEKHGKNPPEEPEGVGVAADRSGEKASTGSEATQNGDGLFKRETEHLATEWRRR